MTVVNEILIALLASTVVWFSILLIVFFKPNKDMKHQWCKKECHNEDCVTNTLECEWKELNIALKELWRAVKENLKKKTG